MSNYTKYIYHLLLFFLFCFELPAIQAHQQYVNFTENKGQWSNQVNFKADLDGGALFVENNCFTYHFYNKTALHKNHINASGKHHNVNTHAFKMHFYNANKEVTFNTSEKNKAHKNYFIGNNSKKWASNVYSWEKIVAKNVYKGIDMETEGIQNGIKYQFNVAANANYKDIQLAFEGVEKIWLKNNELHIKTSVNEMLDQAPIAWQIIDDKKVLIACNYRLNNSKVSFELLGNYNPKYALVIDPILIFASYTGSTADNFGLTATYDGHGNLYTGGLIFDVGYPTTLGAFDETFNAPAMPNRTDISISKFDSTGTSLLYSTYLGGANSTEVVHSMVVNSADELCIYGTTGSNDFPVSASAYDTTFSGGTNFLGSSNGTTFTNGTDIFVGRFSTNGSQLLSCTFIGGTENDGINAASNLTFNYGDYFRGEINVDEFDHIIVGSCTNSGNFPVTSNAVQAVKGNLQDGCIFKFDRQLENLLYSTFLGGNQDDAIYAIALKGSDVYATGGTVSTNIATTSNSYHPSFLGGQADGMVIKLSTVNNLPLVASYIGTVLYDQSYFVQLDANNNVYLFGQTLGAFPYIGGVYQNANSGLFILKLDSSLSTALFSTTFGNGNGTPNISPSAFLVDDCEHIYISGWGGNILTGVPTTGMPLTNNAFQSTTDGFNFYLSVFEHDMDSLIYATYFGGPVSHEHVDGGTSRFDKRGIVYQSVCAGCGSNDDFPTTPGAWSNTNNSSNCNNGVFKFDFEINVVKADFIASPNIGCPPLVVNFTNLGAINYLWDFGNNDTTSTIFNPTYTFNSPGVYPVKLISRDINSCNLADTIVKYITVVPGIEVNFTSTALPCDTTVNFLDLTAVNFPAVNSWLWNFGDSTNSSLQNPTHTFNGIGPYTVQLLVFDTIGCSGVLDTVISFNAPSPEVQLTSNCENNNVIFNALPDSSFSYFWNFGSPASSNNTSNFQQSNFQYPDTGLYQAYLIVYYQNNNYCFDTTFFDVEINPPFIASFAFNQDSCSNAIQFTETTNFPLNPSVQWLWSFGDGQTSTAQNPVNNYLGGNYTSTLIVTAENGCIDTVALPVLIKSYANYAVSADTFLCAAPAEILLQAAGGDFYYWQPAALFTNPTNANQLVTVNTNSIFNVVIGRVNNEGDTCIQNYTTQIEISNIGQTNFNVEAEKDTLFVGESTPINVDITNGNYNFVWTPSLGIDRPNTDNVIASPQVSTVYTLTVSDGSCSRTDSVKIVVFKADCKESSIFIPNTFSPNNDGKNDKLLVRGNYISQLYFAVYNRWGEKVFETNDKNIGWDGYYQGNMSDPGVFGWYLKAICRDGEITEMKGNVTLIR